MKLVERIAKKAIGKLTEERKDDLFVSLIKGQDATEEVDTSRGKFTVKYLKPADRITISRMAAFRRGNLAMDAIDANAEAVNRMISTLDVAVVSGPKWFEEVKKNNSDFSFVDVPDEGFLAELYGKVYSFRDKIAERLSAGTGAVDKRVPAAESADDSVGDGSLEGLSGEWGRTH